MGHMSQSLRYHENNILMTFKHSLSCPTSTFKVKYVPCQNIECFNGLHPLLYQSVLRVYICLYLYLDCVSYEMEQDIYFLVHCKMWA